MPDKPFVVSADGHILEPTDLFITRLPKHLRERGVWEDDFEIEPLVEGGARSSGASTRRGSKAGRSRAIARRAGGCPRATPN